MLHEESFLFVTSNLVLTIPLFDAVLQKVLKKRLNRLSKLQYSDSHIFKFNFYQEALCINLKTYISAMKYSRVRQIAARTRFRCGSTSGQ